MPGCSEIAWSLYTKGNRYFVFTRSKQSGLCLEGGLRYVELRWVPFLPTYIEERNERNMNIYT